MEEFEGVLDLSSDPGGFKEKRDQCLMCKPGQCVSDSKRRLAVKEA